MQHSAVQTLAVLSLSVTGWVFFDLALLKKEVASYLDPEPVVAETFSEDALAEGADDVAANRPMLASAGREADETAPAQQVPPAPIAIPSTRELRAEAAPIFARVTVTSDMRPARIGRLVADAAEKPQLPDLESAARALGLSQRQREEFVQVLEDAVRDLDGLRHAPTESGDTWHVTFDRSIADNQGRGWNGASAHAASMSAFADRRLRNDARTYREAHDGLVSRYAEILRGLLTPDQETTWSKYDPSGLLAPIDGGVVVHLTPTKTWVAQPAPGK